MLLHTIKYHLELVPRGELKRVLLHCLRLRAKGGPRAETDWIDEAMLMYQPPEAINTLCLPGLWEGDVIIGHAGRRAAVATMVERNTRFLNLVKLPARDVLTIYQRYVEELSPVPHAKPAGPAYNRAERERMSTRGIKFYFADPNTPWQSGGNENTNGLLRQYLPKGMDLAGVTQQELHWIAEEMNNRPRKPLGYMTPNEVIDGLLDGRFPVAPNE